MKQVSRKKQRKLDRIRRKRQGIVAVYCSTFQERYIDMIPPARIAHLQFEPVSDSIYWESENK